MSGVHEPGQDVLTVKDLQVNFHTFAGQVKALDGVNLAVKRGVVGGQIILNGKDLLAEKQGEIRTARLREMAMVFQDPLTYLNPVLTVGSQILEILETDRRVFTPVVVAARLEQLERAGRDRPLTVEESTEKGRLEAIPPEAVLGRREF